MLLTWRTIVWRVFYNFKYDSGTGTDFYHWITNNCLNKLITKSFCYLPFREGHHEPHKWRFCFYKQTKRDWQTHARAPNHKYNTLILTRVLWQSKIKLEYYSRFGNNGYQSNRETKGLRKDYCMLFKASPNWDRISCSGYEYSNNHRYS